MPPHPPWGSPPTHPFSPVHHHLFIIILPFVFSLLLLPDIAPRAVLIYLPATCSIHPSCPSPLCFVLLKVGLWVSVSVRRWQWWISDSASVVSDDHNSLLARLCGPTISTLCSIDLSPHRCMSQQQVNMMREGFMLHLIFGLQALLNGYSYWFTYLCY